VLTSDINDICPFPTFSTVASVILATRWSSLVFQVVRLFPERFGLFWPGWPHRISVIVIYRKKYANYELGRHMLQNARAGMPSFGKKSSEPRSQGKWRRWKLWKKMSNVFTGHLLNMVIKKSSSFSGTWTKENKTVNRLLKQALCMVLDLSNSGIIYEVGESLTRSWTLMLDHMIAHQFYSDSVLA